MKRIGPVPVVLALLLAAPLVAGRPALVSLCTQVMIYGVAAIGVDLALGYGGLISLGQAAFFGLGGYTAGIIATQMDGGDTILGWGGSDAALIVWPLAAVVGAVGGALIGLMALRTSGVQFIMLTLAFGQLVHLLLVSLVPFGGDDGMLVPHRTTWPLIGAPSDRAFYVICWAVLCLVLLAGRGLVAAPFGVTLDGLRQNERRVASLGIRPFPMRLAGFTLSAACLGLAGAMWADSAAFVSPDMANWTLSGELLAMVILGGVGTLGGAVLGSAAYVLLAALCTALTERWLLIFGPMLVLVVLLSRGGLDGMLRRVWRRC